MAQESDDENEDIDLDAAKKMNDDSPMDDNEVAALLASLKHKVPSKNINDKSHSNRNDSKNSNNDCNKNKNDDKRNNNNNNYNGKKRRFCEMECESLSSLNKSSEPFVDTDWNKTEFMFIRLTYFNKRKCRKFPLEIRDYSIFTNFIEFYFESLKHCKWHCESDENWIENIDDFNSIRDQYVIEKNLFLELMIINESLPIKYIYAPKAVYIDNPYKCKYPLISTTTTNDNGNINNININDKPQILTTTPHPPPSIPYHASQTNIYQQPPSHPVMPPLTECVDNNGGYHHVVYPHYLNKDKNINTNTNTNINANKSNNNNNNNNNHNNNNNNNNRLNVTGSGAICPDPTTYLPFAHAGQSTPQMRTLHKIVWVLQHQSKPLTIDAIRSCLPGKKKAQINEIDYLLSSYQSYNYTKSTMINGRKLWQLCRDSFPSEFWNMQWQRTN